MVVLLRFASPLIGECTRGGLPGLRGTTVFFVLDLSAADMSGFYNYRKRLYLKELLSGWQITGHKEETQVVSFDSSI